MTDPATVVALVSASLTITMRAAKIGKYLFSLKSKYQKAEKSVQQVSTHVSAIRVAARSLSNWLEDDAVGEEKVEEVKEEMLQVLTACNELLSDLEDYVVKALAGAEKMRFGGRVSYLWNESVIKETTQTLHQQETALILILNALHKVNRSEQRAQLQEPQNREVLTKAKRPSSSIFGLKDDQSRGFEYSILSENSERLDMAFSFDLDLMTSSVYRNWITSVMREKIHQGKTSRQVPGENEEVSSIAPYKESGPTTAQDRWEQIRKNAAERAERRSQEQFSRESAETDNDETIEARVQRIKARVAELTGNAPERPAGQATAFGRPAVHLPN